ncbi:MAG: formate dehydrogenase subunit gamma [Vibrio sp.]
MSICLSFTLPSYADEAPSEVQTQDSVAVGTAEKEMTSLGGEKFFEMAKDGQAGYTTSTSMEHDIAVSPPSEFWFKLKEKWMSPLGALAVLGSLAMVAAAYFIVGPIMLSAPRTGRKIKRWSRWDRTLHWSMAFTFLTLAFSGLTITYGKYIFKPIVPTDVWGMIIYAAKQYHNYIGPIFFILLACVLIKWWRKSIFNKTDVTWMMKLGGMVGKYKGTHPSAGFSNAGEKLIFWMLIFCGFFAAISGFVLDFPIFGQGRRDMDIANMLHMLTALILICGFIFHIYIGLFGMEGALEGMVKGEVDETWAKEHHDLWYEEVKHTAKAEGEAGESNPSKPTDAKV